MPTILDTITNELNEDTALLGFLGKSENLLIENVTTTTPIPNISNSDLVVNGSHFGIVDVGSNGNSGGGTEWMVIKTIKLIVAFIVTTLIIVNNVISLIVLRDLKDIGRRMKILLYSLSISDVCLGFTVCLPALASGALGYWPFSAAACQVSGAMNGVAIGVSLWSLTAISVERYVLIRRPLQRHANQSMVYFLLGVVFIWVFSITFYTFPILYTHNFRYYVYDHDVITCSFRWESTAYFMVAKFVYPVLSGSAILFNNIQIHLTLKKAKFAREKLNARNVSSNNKLSNNSIGQQTNTRKPHSTHHKSNGKLNVDTALPSRACRFNKVTHTGENVQGENTYDSDLCQAERKAKEENEEAETNEQGSSRVVQSRLRKIVLREDQPEDNRVVMSNSMINKNLKARLLLLFTSLLFFTTTAPYMLISLFDHFIPGYQLPAGVKFASLWALHTNSFVNFYVYSFIYSDFRQRYRSLLKKMLFCLKKDSMIDNGGLRRVNRGRGGDGGSRCKSRTGCGKNATSRNEAGQTWNSPFNINENFLNVDPTIDEGNSRHSPISSSTDRSPSHSSMTSRFVSVAAMHMRPLVPRDDAFLTGSCSVPRSNVATIHKNDMRLHTPSVPTSETTTTLLYLNSIYHGGLQVSPSIDV